MSTRIHPDQDVREKRAYKHISKHDRVSATEMYKNGSKLTTIASKYETSVGLVSYWVRNEKLSKTKGNAKMTKDSSNDSEVNVTVEKRKAAKRSQVNGVCMYNTKKSKIIKVKRKPYSHMALQDKLTAIEMYKDGSSISTIASQYETSLESVYYWVRKENVLRNQTDEKPRSYFNPQDKLTAIEMYKNGSQLTTIASKYETTVPSVRNWIRKDKIDSGIQSYPTIRLKGSYSQHDKLAAIEMYKTGSQLTTIASKYKTSVGLRFLTLKVMQRS